MRCRCCWGRRRQAGERERRLLQVGFSAAAPAWVRRRRHHRISSHASGFDTVFSSPLHDCPRHGGWDSRFLSRRPACHWPPVPPRPPPHTQLLHSRFALRSLRFPTATISVHGCRPSLQRSRPSWLPSNAEQHCYSGPAGARPSRRISMQQVGSAAATAACPQPAAAARGAAAAAPWLKRRRPSNSCCRVSISWPLWEQVQAGAGG